MATYLVTGGAGFIGSHVCEALVSRGEQVRVVDDLTTGRRENLAHLDGVALIIGDLTDPEVADRAAAGVDYVVHLAAIPSVPGSIKDPLGSNHANVTGTPPSRSKTCGLRQLVVGLRRYRPSAEARRHAARPAVSLRPAEAHG